ncbi:MAG: InlB B-repeat-containing protein, partial [Alphaproteobacteria bacterium]|nr:InlB B-repeat-containing protein [Alphaproteobacteria bacterium]
MIYKREEAVGKLRSFLGLLAFVFGVVGATGVAVADAEVCPTGYQSNGIACMPIKFTVKYDAGSADAVGTVAEMTCEYDRVCTVKGNGYTWTGHTFQNWKCEGDCVKELWQSGDDIGGGTTVADAVLTLVAQWTANKTNVVLNPNGGTDAVPVTVSAVYDAQMPQIEQLPTLKGYTFAGFWDALLAGEQYYDASGASVRSWDKITASSVLYAHWEECAEGKVCVGDNTAVNCPVDSLGRDVLSEVGSDDNMDCFAVCDDITVANGVA